LTNEIKTNELTDAFLEDEKTLDALIPSIEEESKSLASESDI